MDIKAYWKATLQQDAVAMKAYFDTNACIRWQNTNELFNVDEFIRANCEYPNTWDGVVERIEAMQDGMICVVHVFSTDLVSSFHVTSFITIKQDKITCIDEYWSEDGAAPQWRIDKKIGKFIR